MAEWHKNFKSEEVHLHYKKRNLGEHLLILFEQWSHLEMNNEISFSAYTKRIALSHLPTKVKKRSGKVGDEYV